MLLLTKSGKCMSNMMTEWNWANCQRKNNWSWRIRFSLLSENCLTSSTVSYGASSKGRGIVGAKAPATVAAAANSAQSRGQAKGIGVRKNAARIAHAFVFSKRCFWEFNEKTTHFEFDRLFWWFAWSSIESIACSVLFFLSVRFTLFRVLKEPWR